MKPTFLFIIFLIMEPNQAYFVLGRGQGPEVSKRSKQQIGPVLTFEFGNVGDHDENKEGWLNNFFSF